MDFKKIKKQFDKKNENLNDRGERETNEKIKPKTNEMYDNLRYHISKMSNDDESYRQKMMKLNKSYVKKDELRQKMPSTTSMLRTNLNRDNAMEDTLAYPRSFQLVKKSVAREDNMIEPVKYRDAVEEMDFDNLISKLNNILTEKAKELQFIIQNTEKSGPVNLSSSKIRNYYDKFTNNGAVIAEYNNLMRTYLKPSLAKNSKIIYQSKLQQLNPLISTLEFGCREVIDNLTTSRSQYAVDTGAEAVVLLNSQSLYNSIKNQLNSNSFKLLDQSQLQASLRDVVADLPYTTQASLKNIINSDNRKQISLIKPELAENKLGFYKSIIGELLYIKYETQPTSRQINLELSKIMKISPNDVVGQIKLLINQLDSDIHTDAYNESVLLNDAENDLLSLSPIDFAGRDAQQQIIEQHKADLSRYGDLIDKLASLENKLVNG